MDLAIRRYAKIGESFGMKSIRRLLTTEASAQAFTTCVFNATDGNLLAATPGHSATHIPCLKNMRRRAGCFEKLHTNKSARLPAKAAIGMSILSNKLHPASAFQARNGNGRNWIVTDYYGQAAANLDLRICTRAACATKGSCTTLIT